MKPESSPVIGLEDWNRRFAGFYEIATREDAELLSQFWFIYALHAHFARYRTGKDAPREDIIEDQRADYFLKVEQIRATLTFGLLSPADKAHLEEMAFIFPPDKLGIKYRPAAPRLPVYTPTYHEICEIAGWPRVTNEGLMVLMKAFPGRKISYWEVDLEHYPPDGFGTERAFFSRAAADKCADWITAAARQHPYVAFVARVTPMNLILDRHGIIRLRDIEGAPWSNWLKYLNGDDKYGWKQSVETYLGPGASDPDFEAEAAVGPDRDFDEHEPR